MPLIGRLREGATMAEAQAELRLFQSGVGRLFPWKMPVEWNRDIALQSLQETLVGPVRTRLLLLAAAVLVRARDQLRERRQPESLARGHA